MIALYKIFRLLRRVFGSLSTLAAFCTGAVKKTLVFLLLAFVVLFSRLADTIDPED